MLAKLLILAKFANLSVLAGIVAFGGIIAGQIGPDPVTKVTTAAGEELGDALRDRDSAFLADSDCGEDPAQQNATTDGPSTATECGACACPQATEAAAELSFAGLDLQAAADAGCRVFCKIVTASKAAPGNELVALGEPTCDRRAATSFVPAEELASAHAMLGQPAATDLGEVQPIGSVAAPGESCGQLPCVSAPECRIPLAQAIIAAKDIPVSQEHLISYAAEPSADELAALERSGCDPDAACADGQPAVTCRLRHRDTAEPLATLQIGAQVDTSTLTEEEMAQSAGPVRELADAEPWVQVTQNEYSKAWVVEAHNIELADLVGQLANYYPYPILCGADVRGTVSATVSAYSIDEALHRLVTPFGYQLGREGTALVVGTRPRQPTIDHTDRVSAGSEMAVVGEQPVDRTDVDRLPPVAAASPVATVSLMRTSIHPTMDPADLEVAAAAKLAIQAGNTDEAIRRISTAINERSNSAFLFRLLGEVFAFRTDFERAATALEHSIKLNKYDPTTSQVFSEVLANLGQQRRSEHYAQLSRDIQNGAVVAP